MEPEFEHIDWNDIMEAEVSGELDTLREKAAELKRSGGPKPHSHISPISADRSPSRDHTSPQGLLLHSTPSGQPPASLVGAKRGRVLPHLKPSSCHNTDDYPSLRGLAANDSLDNLLPLASYLSSPTGPSYAQVTRNPKRTLIDRCTSPNDGLVKRSATCDIVKTPTEFNKRLSRVFQNLNGNSIQTPMSWDASPQCNITPESCSLAGKAEQVQRRLFGTHPDELNERCGSPSKKLSDIHRLAQRQKQIDFGKNTIGYERFIRSVPKWKRRKGDPTTPDKHRVCSTRAWLGQIRVWRRQLHKHDPPPTTSQQYFTIEDAALCEMSVSSDAAADHKNK